MQRNFFLTDLMKTGNHMSYERFLRTHSLPNQTIEYTGEYYTLHNYDLDSYDRRFALIDRRIDNTVLYGNKEYYNELDRRVKLLHSQGFKFIMASPWESIENLKSGKIHPNDIGNVNSFNWTGGTSWFWWYMYDKHKDSKFNFDHSNKKYDFLYLSLLSLYNSKTSEFQSLELSSKRSRSKILYTRACLNSAPSIFAKT